MELKSFPELKVLGYHELIDYLEDLMQAKLDECELVMMDPWSYDTLKNMRLWMRIMELCLNKVKAKSDVALAAYTAIAQVLTPEQKEEVSHIIGEITEDHNKELIEEIKRMEKIAKGDKL